MNELLKKINAIQNELSVKKDWENPYYRSKYMTLDNIMDNLQPLLDREWLMIYNYNLKEWGVRTIVTDFENTVSSDFIIGDIRDPQQLGKVLTYWRRYNLVSIFNILADEDDDAQSFYETKAEPKKKYDKKVFGLKELDNLKRQKDKYTFEKAIETIKKDYSIDNEMTKKVWELYDKIFDPINWERRDMEAKDLF